MLIWKFTCPECFAGPGEPCVSLTRRAQSTKFRSDQKTTYDHLKRPHLGRILEAECPKCGNAGGTPCRFAKLRYRGNQVGRKMDKPHRERAAAVFVKSCCYLAPMAPRSARPCGDLENDDTDEWKDVTCKACLAKQPEIANSYARYCGAEFEANLENARTRDYFDDCAQQWGAADWTSLPNDKQLMVRKAFDEGRIVERAARKDSATHLEARLPLS